MIRIGEYNTLEVLRFSDHGLFLSDEERSQDILLPKRYVPEGSRIGDKLELFVYTDSEDRPIATTLKPTITLDDFAVLPVKTVSKFGAFVDWGLAKDLLVPYSEQSKKLVEGDNAVVKLYLDDVTNRLVGTTKIKPYLNLYDIQVKEEDEVDIVIFDITDLGAQVVVNDEYLGLVYRNEIFQSVKVGDKLKGFVRKVREDKKIDVRLQKSGFEHVDANVEKILTYMKENNNFMPLTDRSDPTEIEKVFHISKKVFKKVIGALYKQKKILIKDDGVHLIQ